MVDQSERQALLERLRLDERLAETFTPRVIELLEEFLGVDACDYAFGDRAELTVQQAVRNDTLLGITRSLRRRIAELPALRRRVADDPALHRFRPDIL